MKEVIIKKRAVWAVGAVIALFLSFGICRYTAYAFHGNKDWSMVLFIFGLIILGIAAIFDGRKMMICTVIGYACGLTLGILFNTYGVDGGGGRTSNWWQIWTVSFLVIIVMGVIWEIISKKTNNERKRMK